MASDLDTVELDQIPLPPIPGPLPPTFFTDVPPGSAAIFSTLLGTRAFRPLPNPVPIHTIRSGSRNDIQDKSCYLFKTYLGIAESIVTPPTTWQDLYHYFDATDLWTEGAGFLFHVLGYIVKVNVTKLNFLENYAREWAFSNEPRLANMAPHQDMLSSLQTPDDQAWFDYGNMTSHDKEILNSILKWHREAFQAKRISPAAVNLGGLVQATVEVQRILPAVNLSGPMQVAAEAQRVQPVMNPNAPVQMVVEAQRIPYDMSADPYQHFGRPDYKISPRVSNNLSQPMAIHWEPSGDQARAGSDPPYRNRNTSQLVGGPWGLFTENPHQVTIRNVPRIAENHYVPLDGYHKFMTNRRQSARGGRPLGSFPRQPPVPKGPVYVLDPKKSLVTLHTEAFGVEGVNYTRTSPVYASQRTQNVSFQRRNSRGRREDMQYANHTFVMSNDARFHRDGRFNPVDSGAHSMPREHFKHTARKISWPESDFNKVRSVFVTGFLVETSAEHYLENLFSECGEITNVSVFDEKFYAFITFKDPGSALAAINRFDGFSMEGGKSLTVRYTKGNQRKGSYGNNNARQPMIGAPLQAWAHELPSAPIRNGGHDSRENRRFIRTTPPRNHAYSSSKPSDTLPPNPFQQARDSTAITQAAVLPVKSKYLESQMPHLPAKPQYPLPNSTWNGSPSNISSTQLNCIQGPMQTPEKTQHAAGSEQLSATGRKDSVERSGRSGGRRHYGSENSKTERKTPKKQKAILGDREILASGGSVNTTNSNLRETVSTNSPAKVLPTSAGNPTAESKNMNFVSSVTSPILNTQSKGNRSLSNSRSPTASDVVPQLHDFSGCSTEYPQMDSSTSNSDARSNSVSSTGPDCCSISGQPSRAYIGTLPHKKTLSSESVPATAREVINLALASVLEPPIDPKESDVKTELVHQQKKKKPKNKKRSPNQSNKSSVEITADSSVSPAPRNHPNHGTRDRSKAETRSHLKTDSNTTSSSATSTQSTSPKAETAASPIQRTINCKKSPGRKDLDGSTPPDVPRRQSPRTKKSMQSKSNDGDDVFQDTKSALVKRAQDAKRLSQEKIDISGSETPSTGKSNSSSKKATSQVFEENPTPTRKPQSRHRNNKSDQKTSVLNGKENKKPLPSPTEILSDPSNWPALGSTKLQLDTKSGNIQKSPSIAKPLGERALPPAPIRRDSMASVVSQPPQIFRRLTIDSPNSPVSGGSPLWPIVKRWDGNGRLPGENGNSAQSSSGNI